MTHRHPARSPSHTRNRPSLLVGSQGTGWCRPGGLGRPGEPPVSKGRASRQYLLFIIPHWELGQLPKQLIISSEASNHLDRECEKSGTLEGFKLMKKVGGSTAIDQNQFSQGSEQILLFKFPMQKLKLAIKKVVSSDPFDILLAGDPTRDNYSFAIHTYLSINHQKRREVAANLQKNLKKEHSNRYTMSLLVLCDFLAGSDPGALGEFPYQLLERYTKKHKATVISKEERNSLAENSFIVFYLQLLKLKAWGEQQVSILSPFEPFARYCLESLQAVRLIIKHDFIIYYLIGRPNCSEAFPIAVQNSLRRASEDLALAIRFVEKWLHLIEQNSQHSVEVNQIYEQLIYINKNHDKLNGLKTKLKLEIKFPVYHFNKELNRTIENCMLGKQEERREFMKMSRAGLQKRMVMTEPEDAMEITESEIFVNVKF